LDTRGEAEFSWGNCEGISGTSDNNPFEGQKLAGRMPIKEKASSSKGVVGCDPED